MYIMGPSGPQPLQPGTIIVPPGGQLDQYALSPMNHSADLELALPGEKRDHPTPTPATPPASEAVIFEEAVSTPFRS